MLFLENVNDSYFFLLRSPQLAIRAKHVSLFQVTRMVKRFSLCVCFGAHQCSLTWRTTFHLYLCFLENMHTQTQTQTVTSCLLFPGTVVLSSSYVSINFGLRFLSFWVDMHKHKHTVRKAFMSACLT